MTFNERFLRLGSCSMVHYSQVFIPFYYRIKQLCFLICEFSVTSSRGSGVYFCTPLMFHWAIWLAWPIKCRWNWQCYGFSKGLKKHQAFLLAVLWCFCHCNKKISFVTTGSQYLLDTCSRPGSNSQLGTRPQ